VTIGDKKDEKILAFVLELESIFEILDSLKSRDLGSIRGLFWIEMQSFDAILSDDKYEESLRRETKRLVSHLIEKLTQELIRCYDNKVIVSVIKESPESRLLSRNKRQTEDTKKPLNLAHVFDPSFHSAFAVTAFTALLMAVLVYGIGISMWNMDPNKDSIIYRMTSQRIKKDQ